jgi:glycyl-tRNA synthetase beta chain
LPSLLFEIGCEELPASACREAAAQLPDLCRAALGREPARVLVGPRRLAVLVDDVEAEPEPEWVKGPPAELRDKAAAGFARRHGIAVAELEERDGFLGAVVPGKPLADRLDAILDGLAFGKSMVWEAGGRRFSRPVRWTCGKLGKDPVVGRGSYGHRFLAPGELEIPSAEAYVEALREARVEPDAEERRRRIVEALPEGWRDPLGKLEEVVYLVEWPEVLEGAFDERFLALPPRVVETAMQAHQRYFPLGGNRFAFVANGGEPELVIAGNERVLEGRLEDASFTFERDVAVGIEGLIERLGTITFVAGAGSFADRTARLERLVTDLGGGEASQEAARLAKADQAAELVREFPDLEGHIGAEYARLAGFPEAVCAAVEEQYLPDSAGGPLPATEAGRLLAAADKVDLLAVAFALGDRPTGSRDPYGLRRAAIGLCRLAIEGGLAVDPARLVARDLELLVEQRAAVAGDAAEVTAFVLERLEGLLDVPVEFVRAARAGAAVELGSVAALARMLAAEADSAAFERAYVAYDRSNRLAGKAEGAADALDASLATEPAERALVEVLAAVGPRLEGAVAAGDFRTALAAAAELGPLVDAFFDEVLVMAEDERVRANRLRLLLDVRDAVGALGDLSQIPR